MATYKKVKRKLNIKAFILLLLILYLIVMLFYTFFTMPIKNIYIFNTKLLKDYDVIKAAGIKDYPSIFKTSSKKMESSIATLDLVNKVTVKKKLNGTLLIEIEEAKPLFYNRNTEKVVLSNGREVDSQKYFGLPTLINYVPSDLLKDFINSFEEIDEDIIAMINEIEYSPDISNEVVIDNNRFLLRMNDANNVYVNVINMKRLNDYKNVLMTIGDKRGTLYLDSYNSENSLFTAFGEDAGDNGHDAEN